MIQAKVFDSIVNHNKKLANNIFINERAQVSKLLKGSRLKNLFLELIDSNIIEKERFFDLKKDILLRNQVIISEILNLSRNFNEFNINHINELKNIIKKNYQTLSYFGICKNDLVSFFKTNRPMGVDRVVPIGNTLDFSLNWDGYDLINQMSRIIEIS